MARADGGSDPGGRADGVESRESVAALDRHGVESLLQTNAVSFRRWWWAIFAWVGVPVLYASVLLFGHFGGPFVNQYILVLITAGFVVCGTTAIVKGQRPQWAWVVLLYPLPMFYVLGLIASAIALMSPGRGV
jgi:hypothetical protein